MILRNRRGYIMRALVLSGFVTCILSACGSFEPMEASCLNQFATADYGEVRPIPGGFEVTGSGPAYTPLVIEQAAAPMRPGTAGDPRDDYPKPAMRYFVCTPLHD